MSRTTNAALLLGILSATGVLVASPAAAETCQSDYLGLDSITKPMKADLGPRALRDVGAFNAAMAHDLGGLHFGPVAKAHNETCR